MIVWIQGRIHVHQRTPGNSLQGSVGVCVHGISILLSVGLNKNQRSSKDSLIRTDCNDLLDENNAKIRCMERVDVRSRTLFVSEDNSISCRYFSDRTQTIVVFVRVHIKRTHSRKETSNLWYVPFLSATEGPRTSYQNDPDPRSHNNLKSVTAESCRMRLIWARHFRFGDPNLPKHLCLCRLYLAFPKRSCL